MIKLGVNIDHVATLRQARGTNYPDPVEAAFAAQRGGASSITVHLREDRRHIQDHDVINLLKVLKVPLNLEMAITDEMLTIACDLKPAYVCLVPEKRQELTTEGGLDVAGQLERVDAACQKLRQAGIRVSLFIDPDSDQVSAAAACKVPMVEIHTGLYANAADTGNSKSMQDEFSRVKQAAVSAAELDLQVNAGHGLNYNNVQKIAAIEQIEELNIGHSIIAKSVIIGLEAAVHEMQLLMNNARQ
ncbi:MAG: pyridoxine 5'-phosphate synthase [Gammaproteobacteria bacterium]